MDSYALFLHSSSTKKFSPEGESFQTLMRLIIIRLFSELTAPWKGKGNKT